MSIRYSFYNLNTSIATVSNSIGTHSLVASDLNNPIPYLTIRLELFKKLISNLKSWITKFSLIESELVSVLINNYSLFSNQIAKYYVNRKEFAECKEFLFQELNESLSLYIEKVITLLVRLNDLYTFTSKEEIYNLYINNRDKLENSKRFFFDKLIWFYPVKLPILYYKKNYTGNDSIIWQIPSDGNGKVSEFFLAANFSGKGSDQKFNTSDSEIQTTIIDFIVPLKIESEPVYSSKEKITFHFFNKIGFFQHPLYDLIAEFYVGGITLEHLIDIGPEHQDFTWIRASISESFHPEFRFEHTDEETNVIANIFSEEEAISGRKFLPTKNRVIRGLRDIVESNILESELALLKINADLFSTFQTTLLTSNGPKMISYYFFTSDILFNKASIAFYDKITELHSLSSDFTDEFKNYKISSQLSFHNFIIFLFEKVVINHIRYKSGYKNFWRDQACKKDPKNEPEVQPYLLNVIESLCELKGVSAIREPASAEGEIDIFFSYTLPENGRLIKICVEVKKAHHDKIESGVSTQLIDYMKSQSTVYGLYAVLWFKYSKGEGFDMPKGYNSQIELIEKINTNIPINYNIKTILIDCTKPKSPSY